MTRIAVTWSLVTGAILIVANWTVYRTNIDVSPISPKLHAVTEQPQGSGDALLAEDVRDFSVTLERPLFSKSRRRFVPTPIEPAPVETAVLVGPAPPTDPVISPEVLPKLLGISIGAEVSKALFRVDGEEAQWHVKDELLAGWLIVAIEKDRVLVARDGRETRIQLYPVAGVTTSRNPSDVQ